MIEKIIEYSIRNKFFVILVTGVIIGGGASTPCSTSPSMRSRTSPTCK